MLDDLRLSSLIVCEQVREEGDGRCTLIGVWPDNIVFLPEDTAGRVVVPNISFYMQFHGGSGRHQMALGVSLNNDEECVSDVGEVDLHDEMNVICVKLRGFKTLGFNRHVVVARVGAKYFNTWFDVAPPR